MNNTNTEYKIAEGTKTTFEEEINKLSKDGYIWCGSLTSSRTVGGTTYYSQLMSKYTPPNKD